MNFDNADEIIEKLYKSLLKIYQICLEISIKGSYFISDCLHIMYYKYHKIKLNCGVSYIDSPDWIKNKKCNNTSCK